MSNIISKTIGIEIQLKEALIEIEGLIEAFIYGSFASGTQDSLSDIDILIVGDIEEDDLVEKISKLEERFEREINYQIYSSREFKEKSEDKNSFISKILSKPVIDLIHKNS